MRNLVCSVQVVALVFSLLTQSCVQKKIDAHARAMIANYVEQEQLGEVHLVELNDAAAKNGLGNNSEGAAAGLKQQKDSNGEGGNGLKKVGMMVASTVGLTIVFLATSAFAGPALQKFASKIVSESELGDQFLARSGREMLEAAAKRVRSNQLQFFGKQDDLYEILALLGRAEKSSVVMVAPPGTGKSAYAEGIAELIASQKVPPGFQNARMYELSATDLTAGSKYVGELESRVKALRKAVDEAAERGELVILWMDEIHTMVNAGAGSTNPEGSLGNLLKDLLARDNLRILGATTPEEVKTLTKMPALGRRFKRVDLPDVNAEIVAEIASGKLTKYKSSFAKFYPGVEFRFEDGLMSKLKVLADQNNVPGNSPDRELSLINDVMAKKAMTNFRSTTPQKVLNVTEADLVQHMKDVAKIGAL